MSSTDEELIARHEWQKSRDRIAKREREQLENRPKPNASALWKWVVIWCGFIFIGVTYNEANTAKSASGRVRSDLEPAVGYVRSEVETAKGEVSQLNAKIAKIEAALAREEAARVELERRIEASAAGTHRSHPNP